MNSWNSLAKKTLTKTTFFLLLLSLTACTRAIINPTEQVESSKRLNVVATTSLIGDIVGQIGGSAIDLTVLLPRSVDPHTYIPSPRDIRTISAADVVFMNGVGLESAILPWLESALGGGAKDNKPVLVSVSTGVELHYPNGTNIPDPHVWFDPRNVIIWTENISTTLAEFDQTNAGLYKANKLSYQKEIKKLDDWIQSQVSQVPSTRRYLITDHHILTYFAWRYGFTQIGTIIPGITTAVEPSAQDLVNLINLINKYEVSTIFISSTINQDLTQQIAADMKINLVSLYSDTLTEREGEAGSYLALMHYDVQAIVSALK